MTNGKTLIDLLERFTCAAVLFLLIAAGVLGKDLLVGDATERALAQSSLTLPGSKPFHMKVDISETSDPGKDDYKASIDEYWISPSKWRRVITSKDFSQTLITNGDAVSESNTGDYYPHWLSNFVTAVIDLMPPDMAKSLKGAKAPVQAPLPGTQNCASMSERVDRWVVCFEDNHGLFQSIFRKGYWAEFKDYKKFGSKWVARDISGESHSGITVRARISELSEITQPDERMFVVDPATPLERRIRSVRVDEDTFHKLLLGSMDVQWPAVGEGKLKGGCGLYISADRSGQIREATPEGCDNAAMAEPLRDAAMKWQLKPAVSDGSRVQIEALLGIPFETTLDAAKSPPILTDSEARALASNKIEPVYPPNAAARGTEFIVQISVDETGKFTGMGGAQGGNNSVTLAIYGAVSQWHFKPYIKDGKTQYFHANLVFRMP